MKPRNAQQRKVMELSRRLNPITDKQVQWAYAHCLEHIAYRTAKNMLTCGDCGHTWKSESTLGDTSKPNFKKYETATNRQRKKKTKYNPHYLTFNHETEKRTAEKGNGIEQTA